MTKYSEKFVFLWRMKCLYLFNPENDMALAYGGPYYMPPSNARKMAHDLAALPLWYASSEGEVWLPEFRQVAWMKECGLSPEACGVVSLRAHYDRLHPWGWSASMVRRLQEAGVEASCCPTEGQIQRIRTLSARATAVEVLRSFEGDGVMGESCMLYSLDETIRWCKERTRSLLKAPWSGSGRGIQPVEKELPLPLQGWTNHILKTQGYVVGEPYYNKVVDFAMEFLACQGKVSFVGYSFFETDARGIYKENLLAADETIEERLSVYVPRESLCRVREHLEGKLAEVIGDGYDGYLGVDMMVCRTGEGFAVHPCVEINLRMNMGVVSRLLYDHYITPGVQGRFVIEYYTVPGEALRMHRAMQECHPLVLQDGRIRQGYLSLTPVFEETLYQAYVLVQ